MQIYRTNNTAQQSVNGELNMDIVQLKPADFAIASEYLSAAFCQDPLIGYFLPEDAAAKQKAFKHLSRSFLDFAQPYGHIYTTTEEPKGVAIWLPPEAFKITLSQLWQAVTSGLLFSPFYLRWTRIVNFISLLSAEIQLHEKLAPEPHWYLGMLGVSPECQGQGIGGKLLQHGVQMADRAKLPCYLETTTPAAVRFYQRYGFEMVHQGVFAEHEYWAMKRHPKS